jgi:hypothetical protein
MIQPTVSWRAGRPRPGGADGCRSRLAPSPNYFMGWRRSMVDVPRPVAIMRRSVGLCGGIGRRGRLKICFLQGSGGSSPSRAPNSRNRCRRCHGTAPPSDRRSVAIIMPHCNGMVASSRWVCQDQDGRVGSRAGSRLSNPCGQQGQLPCVRGLIHWVRRIILEGGGPWCCVS